MQSCLTHVASEAGVEMDPPGVLDPELCFKVLGVGCVGIRVLHGQVDETVVARDGLQLHEAEVHAPQPIVSRQGVD